MQTADLQLNITSPLIQGTYVAGQILPCTYTPAIPANLKLNIYLKPLNVYYTEQVIAYGADVSNNPVGNVPIVVDGQTYYQHSINYPIPATAPAGNYEVIYQNMNTNSNTSIPISVLAYVATATANVPATAAPTVAASTGSAQSTIKLNATASSVMPCIPMSSSA
ncbi:hypothetical protein K501DRAFT_172423 [Backusella circina FSU 941]|nr:hypothetical protein K501DRAFT_172423 [Backusella circina FSU 941]